MARSKAIIQIVEDDGLKCLEGIRNVSITLYTTLGIDIYNIQAKILYRIDTAPGLKKLGLNLGRGLRLPVGPTVNRKFDTQSSAKHSDGVGKSPQKDLILVAGII